MVLKTIRVGCLIAGLLFALGCRAKVRDEATEFPAVDKRSDDSEFPLGTESPVIQNLMDSLNAKYGYATVEEDAGNITVNVFGLDMNAEPLPKTCEKVRASLIDGLGKQVDQWEIVGPSIAGMNGSLRFILIRSKNKVPGAFD